MKKLIVLLFAIACLSLSYSSAFATINMVETIYNDWFFLGDFHQYEYASKVDFYTWQPNGWLGGVWIGTNPSLPLSLDWAHTIPDLAVPPDQIDRAKLWIDGAFIDGNNNTIEIEGIAEWDPLNRMFLDNSTYWLTNVSEPGFWNDGNIDVTVTAGEWSLRLDQSILMMDYTSAPIPEPGTFILLGSGLLGLGAFRFRRRK